MVDESNWVNRIITAGIIGMIGWTLFTVNEVSTKVAVLQTELTNIRSQLTATTLERYTRSEAVADRALLEQRISRLEEWNTRLSQRVNKAEESVARHETLIQQLLRELDLTSKKLRESSD